MKDNSIYNMETTKPATEVTANAEETPVTYDQLKNVIDKFFQSRDYESNISYKKGYACSVGEDFKNIDLIQNMYEIIYDYCVENNVNMTASDRANFKSICKGVQMINAGLSQYNDDQLDKNLTSTLLGYMLKIIRNYFHD